MKDTLQKTDYQSPVNQILRKKGINPYEWEPYDGFALIPIEELDYLENGQRLFQT